MKLELNSLQLDAVVQRVNLDEACGEHLALAFTAQGLVNHHVDAVGEAEEVDLVHQLNLSVVLVIDDRAIEDLDRRSIRNGEHNLVLVVVKRIADAFRRVRPDAGEQDGLVGGEGIRCNDGRLVADGHAVFVQLYGIVCVVNEDLFVVKGVVQVVVFIQVGDLLVNSGELVLVVGVDGCGVIAGGHGLVGHRILEGELNAAGVLRAGGVDCLQGRFVLDDQVVRKRALVGRIVGDAGDGDRVATAALALGERRYGSFLPFDQGGDVVVLCLFITCIQLQCRGDLI